MTTLEGQTIGAYELIRVLGQGGMATVYLARAVNDGVQVAVKLIRMEKLPQEMAELFIRRFEQEARQMGRLHHPNIVQVLASGYHHDNPYLVMTYVAGGTLKDRATRPLPWREAVRLLKPIALALDSAHQAGVIHRDVKPANILLQPDGTPMLSDFGIAKNIASGDATVAATLTMTGALMGTPEYMAPEQVKGSSADPRVDIYALGVVLYELVTGRRPFVADTPWEVLAKHLTEPVPRPGLFVPGLPRRVEAVILKAMAKQPADRFASMDHLAAELDSLEYAPASRGRRWLFVGLGGVLSVAACVGASSLAWNALQAATSPTAVSTLTQATVPFSPTPPVATTDRVPTPPATLTPRRPTRTVRPTTAAAPPTASRSPTATLSATASRRPITRTSLPAATTVVIATAELPTVVPTAAPAAPPTAAPPTAAPTVAPTPVPPSDTPPPLPPTTEPTPTAP